MKDMLLLDEVAARCRTHPSTVRQWIREGRLAAFRPGRRVLVQQAELERFLKANRQLASEPAPQITA